jgi:hypothetical protein
MYGWRTLLQAGRPRVRFPMRSLDFSIEVILPAGKWVPGIFLGVKGGRSLTHNFIAICESIVKKMWEPRRLTILRASTTCYKHSFTFYVHISLKQRFFSSDPSAVPVTMAAAFVKFFWNKYFVYSVTLRYWINCWSCLASNVKWHDEYK